MIREIHIVGETPEDDSVQDVDVTEAEINCDQEDISYEELLRRQDDIDQLTSDYISCLMYPHIEDTIDFEPEVLEKIENRIEEVLAEEFGIIIYRPTALRRNDGSEVIVPSIYDCADYLDDLYEHE